MSIEVLDIDIAKNVFQFHGSEPRWRDRVQTAGHARSASGKWSRRSSDAQLLSRHVPERSAGLVNLRSSGTR